MKLLEFDCPKPDLTSYSPGDTPESFNFDPFSFLEVGWPEIIADLILSLVTFRFGLYFSGPGTSFGFSSFGLPFIDTFLVSLPNDLCLVSY